MFLKVSDVGLKRTLRQIVPVKKFIRRLLMLRTNNGTNRIQGPASELDKVEAL